MTDNIIKFPNRHLDVEVELDETEEEYMEMVYHCSICCMRLTVWPVLRCG